MDPLDVIAVQLPLLGDPGTCAAAASALQAAYSKIWANVHDTGTLGDLRAGLQARNLLYEGNAISAMHRVLASGSPTPREAGTATNLLGLLASLLQDVPSLFAAEGYANLLHQALPEPNALIVPDLAELNALRAAPLFVTLALNTLLDRPERLDCAPHVSVSYINDLLALCSVDSATAAALPRLLADKPFRAALFRGLQGADERKLLKCLQLLQRCLGGGPPGTQTTLPHTSSAVALWGFRTLIDHGATRPLTAACRSVLRVLRRASAPRTLAALLHSTLLDALDAACATDVAAAGTVLRPHSADGAHDAGDSAHSRSNNNNNDDSSDAGRNWEWPPELLLAHAALVLEVSRRHPGLVTSLARMRPYAAQPAAAEALRLLGVDASMGVLMQALAAADPADVLLLPHHADAFEVATTLAAAGPDLASAALRAGGMAAAARALQHWAVRLPGTVTGQCVEYYAQEFSPMQLLSGRPEQMTIEPALAAAQDDAPAGTALRPGGAATPAVRRWEASSPEVVAETAATVRACHMQHSHGGGGGGAAAAAAAAALLPHAAAATACGTPVMLTYSVDSLRSESCCGGGNELEHHADAEAAHGMRASLKLLTSLLESAVQCRVRLELVDTAPQLDGSWRFGAALAPAVAQDTCKGPANAAARPSSSAAAVQQLPPTLPALLTDLADVPALQHLADRCLSALCRLGVQTPPASAAGSRSSRWGTALPSPRFGGDSSAHATAAAAAPAVSPTPATPPGHEHTH